MAQQKSKKGLTWVQCENCSVLLYNKDTDCHSKDCPPKIEDSNYSFIKNKSLHGFLEEKLNEEIKNITPHERTNLVFLSEAVIRLCSLAIGEWAIIQNLEEDISVAKIVWPTAEKSVTSVLFTKSGVDLSGFSSNQRITVKALKLPVPEAVSVTLTILNAPKSLELTNELYVRLNKCYEDKIFSTGNKLSLMYYGKELKFEIKLMSSNTDKLEDNLQTLSISERHKSTFYKVTTRTKWIIYKDEDSYVKEADNQFLSCPAGVNEEISEIFEYVKACLGHLTHKIRTNAILLYGHSGTGKSIIAKYIASKSNANVITINAPDIFSFSSSSIEKHIKQLIDEAVENSPSIIILDEFDVLCPSRSSRLTEIEKRVVSIFLKIFDDLHTKNSKVFILAISNKPDNIDSAFRRCGRLDREIEIPTPNPKSRRLILETLFNQQKSKISDQDLQEISMKTHGFVGSDLVSLSSVAILNAIRRNDKFVTVEDLEYALKKVRPSAMREVQIEVSNVKWSDIGGQDNLKMVLKQAVEWPLKYPQSFLRLGVTPPKGVLMFGPPGCSKTMIAKALAFESGLNFLSIKGPELFSKWVGESERAVREVFRKARQVAPSIIFFDEIDALGGERSGNSGTNVQERVLAQLLTELDGITPLQDVTILAATNRPDRIDKALLRPGRLDRIVYVPLPNAQTRKDIFRIKFLKMPTSGVNIDDLVNRTDKYSGAEVNAVCHEAAMVALEANLESQFVEMKHFEKALELVTPRTPSSLIKLYEDYLSIKL